MDDQPLRAVREQIATLVEENSRLRALLADMWRVAVMSQTHTPDEIREIYGDLSQSFERARQLLESPPGQKRAPDRH